MNLKDSYSLINSYKVIDYLFVFLIFILPFIAYPFLLNSTKVGQELYLVCVIALCFFFKTLTIFKRKLINIQAIDILFFTFLAYCTIHYYYYSYYGFLYNGFWIFSGYIFLFYLFTSCFYNIKNDEKIFLFAVNLIWILATIQSIIALLQEFNFVKSDNAFFKVVGTFINPNFLAIAMLVGLLGTLYLICFSSKNRILKIFLVFTSLLMIYTLLLTQSRAVWMALPIAITIFYITSEKNIFYIKKNKSKTFAILCAVFFLIIASLYLLYKMDSDSVDGRNFIRKIIVTKISDNPLLGNGIFNFPGVYNQSKADYFLESERPWSEIKVGDYAALAFNDYVQIIFEIGIIGLFLIVVIFLSTLKDLVLNPKTRLAFALIISFCLLAIFTSVIYNPNAMIYLIWALSILAVNKHNKLTVIKIESQFLVKLFAFLLITISFFAGFIFYKKTNGLYCFKTIIENPEQKIYYKLNDFDLLFIIEDPYVEFRVGAEKYQDGDMSGLKMMEESIKKNPIPTAIYTLANTYVVQNNYLRVEELLKLNTGIEPNRLEPLVNLMDYYAKTNNVLAIIAAANKIIAMPIKIPSKKADEYKNRAKIVLETEKKLYNNHPY